MLTIIFTYLLTHNYEVQTRCEVSGSGKTTVTQYVSAALAGWTSSWLGASVLATAAAAAAAAAGDGVEFH